MRYININAQNEITESYQEGHPDIDGDSILITDTDFDVIKANGYSNCKYIGGTVVFNQALKDSHDLDRAKQAAIHSAVQAATNEIINAKAQPTINKINAINNQAALDALDVAADVAANP